MENVKIEHFDGHCPIQSWGTVNGHKYYFKARGSMLRLMINEEGQDPLLKADWNLELPYKALKGGAGNMLYCEAYREFERMMQRYLDGDPSGGSPGYLRKRRLAA